MSCHKTLWNENITTGWHLPTAHLSWNQSAAAMEVLHDPSTFIQINSSRTCINKFMSCAMKQHLLVVVKGWSHAMNFTFKCCTSGSDMFHDNNHSSTALSFCSNGDMVTLFGRDLTPPRTKVSPKFGKVQRLPFKALPLRHNLSRQHVWRVWLARHSLKRDLTIWILFGFKKFLDHVTCDIVWASF